MHTPDSDLKNLTTLLNQTLETSLKFIQTIDAKPPGIMNSFSESLTLCAEGMGGSQALKMFFEKYGSSLSGSAGPRNFSFVIGGATPASLMGDWLASAFDINASYFGNSCAPDVELETISFLRQLLSFPDSYQGLFVSGATMSNFVGLAQGREWAAQHQGIKVNQDGLYGLKPIPVLSGSIHSSAIKALSMLGMGRKSYRAIPLVSGRESVDLTCLEEVLQSLNGEPCIVVANAGTVNTGDFDQIDEISKLKEKYTFWLHVDAAFGGFLACSTSLSHLTKGMNEADSVTIDLHKWLNVPYDSAIALSKHTAIQREVFQNNAAYLNSGNQGPIPFADLGPENSRRFRALAAWFHLIAYGKSGCTQIVDQNLKNAKLFGEKISGSQEFELLSPIHSNIVCFALKSSLNIDEWIAKVNREGKVFFSKTEYLGRPAIRAAFVNWRTNEHDLQIAWESVRNALI